MRITWIWGILLIGGAWRAIAGGLDGLDGWEATDRYNVVWNSPSRDSSGSMPLGNGDVGLNVWAEENGDLVFYVSKTDAWNENDMLLKLGRIRVKIEPNPFAKGLPFRQELRLREGRITIAAGKEGDAVSVGIWVDANRPVIHVQGTSQRARQWRVELEVWRNKPRRLSGEEANACREMTLGPYPIVVEPDTVLPAHENRLLWYHRNEKSCYETVMRVEQLGELIGKYRDPYLGRTFGGMVEGEELVAQSDRALATASPTRQLEVGIHVLTAQTETAASWRDQLERQAAQAQRTAVAEAWQAHARWWEEFWKRSWIHVLPAQGSGEAAERPMVITRGYALQRFIAACGGRGAQPIKFNGSIFTVDDLGRGYDADYRAWGGGYWFQNTRLAYWPMLAAGDYDLMQPWFRMYRAALALAKDRTRVYYKHDGAYFCETMLFWGVPAPCDWGWSNPGPDTVNNYIKYYWSGGLELLVMMLDYYDQTEDRRFAQETLLPVAVGVTTFFDQHWKRDARGKIRFEPAQSLETWHTAVNPLPEIAGLQFVLPRLIGLPESLATDTQRAAWRKTLADLPEVPVRSEAGRRYLLPAEQFDRLSNSENPELYAVFPYRVYGLGKPELETALEAWDRRRVKRTGGWTQDAIQAALVGRTEEAAAYVASNFSTKHAGSRFPAFWGPNFDWIPDQDHGSVAMLALERMLMQCEGKKIVLLPAWPKSWDVEFKLHAPLRTTVEGVYRDGRIEQLRVSPEARRRDVSIASGT